MEITQDVIDQQNPTSLLYEIVTREESHDLRLLVEKMKSIIHLHLIKTATEWKEKDEKTLILFLQDQNLETVFVIQFQDGRFSVIHHVDDGTQFQLDRFQQIRRICYFIKLHVNQLITPTSYDAIVKNGLVHVDKIPDELSVFAQEFVRQSYVHSLTWREYRQLTVMKLLNLNSCLLKKTCMQEAILLKPLSITSASTTAASQDEDYVELLEKTALQWIMVLTYNLEFRNYSTAAVNERCTLAHEMTSWESKCRTLSTLQEQLQEEEYCQVQSILKKANSVLWDELTSLCATLQEEITKSQLTIKYLSCLSKPISKLKSCQLSDVPIIYEEILDKCIIIAIHAPGYECSREKAAEKLLYLTGNEVIDRYSLQATDNLNKLIKGHTAKFADKMEFLRKCLNQCTDMNEQIMKSHKTEGNLNWKLRVYDVLSNFHSLNVRCLQVLEICQYLQQFARFEEGMQKSLPVFSTERDADVGQMLRQARDYFTSHIPCLLSANRDCIFNIHNYSWYHNYNRFQSEARDVEVALVHTFEEAVSRCATLWNQSDLLFCFEHLYPRPLFTAAMNSTANSLFKSVSQEVKSACKIDFCAWNTPISTILTTHSIQLVISAQRARGYIDKMAKLIQLLNWVGSSNYQNKALTRCRQAHQLLGDVIKKEFHLWVDRLNDDLIYKATVALQKFVIVKHFQRPDWIQPNLDGVVLVLIQSAESWDRLLVDLPQSVQHFWQERQDLRTVHESISTMSHYYNSIIADLTPEQKEMNMDLVTKLESSIMPGLNQLTWNHLTYIKRFVANCFTAMEELIQAITNSNSRDNDE